MIYTIIGVLVRIFSNSYLNVFQKLLTNRGKRAEVINFNTYLGLTFLGLFIFSYDFLFTKELLFNVLMMGLLGALGNYCMIKALSIGELSTLAPINSYKPVVALIFGIFYLHELPSIGAILAIILIILGSYFVLGFKRGIRVNSRAIYYRVLALIFSGSEAIFIKKVILLCGIANGFFFWAFAGLMFSTLIYLVSNSYIEENKFNGKDLKHLLLLIFSVGIMQYSTNYVFARINVSYALALFQLSSILSIFLGVNIFAEKNLREKLLGAIIMFFGACILILLK